MGRRWNADDVAAVSDYVRTDCGTKVVAEKYDGTDQSVKRIIAMLGDYGIKHVDIIGDPVLAISLPSTCSPTVIKPGQYIVKLAQHMRWWVESPKMFRRYNRRAVA